MRKSNLLSAIALLSSSANGLENGVTSNMPCFNDICWTSWKCRYDRASKYDSKLGNKCGLPSNVYRQGYDAAPWTTLVWGEHYEMSWTANYATQGEEVVLEWLMFAAPGTERRLHSDPHSSARLLTYPEPISANETDMFPDYRGKGPERFVVAYSQSEFCALVAMHDH
jgi:hypothetical protein